MGKINWSSKKQVLTALRKNPMQISKVSESLRDDKDVVMEAVQQDGYAIKYASKRLQSDKEIVLTAVQTSDYVLDLVPQKLRDDKDVVMAAVQRCGRALQYASKNLRDDKDVVMAAVQQHEWLLQYASKNLRDDKDVVMVAVQQDGEALQYASKNLRDDKDVVMLAVQQDGRALQYASKKLCDDKGVVMTAVQQNGLYLEYASKRLRDDIVMAAIQQEHVSEATQKSRDIVMGIITYNPHHLMYDIPEGLQNDESMIIAALLLIANEGKDYKEYKCLSKARIAQALMRDIPPKKAIEIFSENPPKAIAGLLKNKDFLFKLIALNPMCVHWLSKKALNSSEVRSAVIDALDQEEEKWVIDSVGSLYN